MSTATINHVNKPILDQIMFERRVLFGCTAFLSVSTIIWIVAISTDHWFLVHGGTGIYIPQTKRYFLESHSGIWRICRTVLIPKALPMKDLPFNITNFNDTVIETTVRTNHFPDPKTAAPRTFCKYHEMFPSKERIQTDLALDSGILNYSRTEASFAIISLFLMMMGFAFSIYTFLNPRYTFKRLAGACHGITAISVLTVIEVLCSSIEYERGHLLVTYPDRATDSYGYSMYLAWFVFLIHFFTAIAFLMYSKKRKGSKAATDEMGMIDEPAIIGR